jgi:hypothetical protein
VSHWCLAAILTLMFVSVTEKGLKQMQQQNASNHCSWLYYYSYFLVLGIFQKRKKHCPLYEIQKIKKETKKKINITHDSTIADILVYIFLDFSSYIHRSIPHIHIPSSL